MIRCYCPQHSTPKGVYKNTLFDVLTNTLINGFISTWQAGLSQLLWKMDYLPVCCKAFSLRTAAILLVFIPLEEAFNSHNLDYMIYTDETQLDMQPGEGCANPLAKLELCTRYVITRCANIALICNPGKAEVVHFSSRFSKYRSITRHRSKWNCSSIHLFSLQFSFCFR